MKRFTWGNWVILMALWSAVLFGQSPPTTTIEYDSSGALFPNPERGFSAHRSSPITLSFCEFLRNQNVTVIQRIYTIPQYRNDTLSSAFLNQVAEDFNTARAGGVKLVLRFSYTSNINGEDAPLDTILHHIAQLTSLFQEHYDVIAYVEAGFIGAWGEWYYSTNNLNNTQDRRTVLFALLDALPVERMACVRTPNYKRRIFTNTQPLTPEEAFSGTRRARTGAHNDCFLASVTDYGTYIDTLVDKTYLHLDNRYVPQGGETCNPSAYSGCQNALQDLERMRWSVLNKDYHPTVLQGWVNNGCMEEAKHRLGYRFRLHRATLPDSVRPEGAATLTFSVINDGWASPYNPRNLEIILRHNLTRQLYFLKAETDPRMWMAGDTARVTLSAGIPADMALGEYELLLHFADPRPLLHDRPEYAIRLANETVWEEETGLNRLLHSLVVDPASSGENYSGEHYFQPRNDITAIQPDDLNMFDNFELKGNYPNPFNGQTTIEFDLHRPATVKINVYNVQGEFVDAIFEQNLSPGTYYVPWNPQFLSSGVYIYQVAANDERHYRKIIYLK